MSYKITASVDWCEQNFAVFPFVAEFWNTLSSVPLCLFAVHSQLFFFFFFEILDAKEVQAAPAD